MSPLLVLSEGHLDQQGVLYFAHSVARPDLSSSIYHPSNIAQYALAHWNAYLLNGGEQHRDAFLRQVNWLLTHEVRLSGDVSVWPVPFAVPEYYAPAVWASASVQGYVISALIRAYQLTGSEMFLQPARRAVGAFRLDILDGGVAAPVGEDGLFFEEVAVYPAAHILNGCFLALFGLYDYVGVTQDGRVEVLIERCVTTLHTLLKYFDTGYWSRYDLLSGHLAPEFYHTLHVTLLGILGRYTGCDHCLALAARWESYAHNPLCYLRYSLVSRLADRWDRKCKPWLRARLFGSFETVHTSSSQRVCVPLSSLPDADRIRDTLIAIAHVMEQRWQISYLIQHVGLWDGRGGVDPPPEAPAGGGQRGPEAPAGGFGWPPTSPAGGGQPRPYRPTHPTKQPEAKRPGTRFHPWRFPGILLYCWHGGLHLFRLLRQGKRYHLLLPQDGIVCAAFAGLLGKLMGARVVCMDSGSMLWLAQYPQTDRKQEESSVIPQPAAQPGSGYLGEPDMSGDFSLVSRTQRTTSRTLTQQRPWYKHFYAWPGALLYRSSLRLLGAIAARCCDQFLLANEEVAEIYRLRLNVRPDRILHSVVLVDTARFAALDQKAKLRLRIGRGLSPDVVLIALAYRPTLCKDVCMDMRIALGGVVQALRALPPNVRTRIRVLIAAEKTAHAQVMSEIMRYHLKEVCWLWGEAVTDEVTQLLSMADVFLSVGSHGADDMVTVLEAMAAGCAVVATRTSLSNAKLLSEGRGIGILPDNTTEIGIALADLCKDLDLCRHIGRKAREYVARHHSIQMLQRNLLRASFFAPSLPVS
jgi:glycosyltransferase involved in cell wall biosynthesis